MYYDGGFTRSGMLFFGRTLAAVVLVAAVLMALSASPGRAGTTISVKTTQDEDNNNGLCSLREAITAANTDTPRDTCPAGDSEEADTITFDPVVTGTIRLASALPALSTDTKLEGPGADELTVRRSSASGTPEFRVFTVTTSGTVSISGLTISNGNAADDAGGGIGKFGGGTLNVSDSTISDNSSEYGGGIAIENVDGTVSITRSTISDNSSAYGGGILNANNYGDGPVNVSDSTISNNSADYWGGGIYNSGTANITASTIFDNDAAEGGGIYNNSGTVSAKNSIVAGNTGGDVSSDPLTDGGFNFIGGDPMLGLLQDNGGPTETHLPLEGSPVIDQGDDGSPTSTTDQRGETRPQDDLTIANAPGGDGSDIGAVEVEPPVEISMGDASVTEGNTGTKDATFTVTLSNQSTRTVTVDYATTNGTAIAPSDYTSTSGTLTFAPGQRSKTISVPVVGDKKKEKTESFSANLSGAENATLTDGQGKGTIQNDDKKKKKKK